MLLLDDDSQYDFEVICGARRHWTAKHLSWPLLIEVRDLDDRQAFILQDLENRDREDVSDYERATDYKGALPKYFENNRTAMAKFLEIDKGNFHRLLELAELPKTIVDAYSDLRELRVHHGTAYRKLLADSAVKRRLLDRAKSIKGQGLQGSKVFSTLKSTAVSQQSVSSRPTVSHHGVIQATRKPASSTVAIVLTLTQSGEKVGEPEATSLRADFEAILEDLRNGKL